MKRMIVLCLAGLVLVAALCQAQSTPRPATPAMTLTKMDEAKQKDWLARWDKNITGTARGYRTCDREVGEGIAWVMTPVMDGFYCGYMATKVQVLRMWPGLAPYDTEIQKNFEATEDPDSWGGLSRASYYLMLQSRLSDE